jgi:hypothetical protein
LIITFCESLFWDESHVCGYSLICGEFHAFYVTLINGESQLFYGHDGGIYGYCEQLFLDSQIFQLLFELLPLQF